MRIIFLDIDGVLNNGKPGLIDRDCVGRLNRIVAATDAKIVLSSSWRYMVHRNDLSLAGFEFLLRTHGATGVQVIGVTPSDETFRCEPNIRGKQIRRWLANNCDKHQVETCVALDDTDCGISEIGYPLVLTDGRKGLRDADVEKAIELLRE